MAEVVVSPSDNLDAQGKAWLRGLLGEYKDVFRQKTDPPGRVTECAVSIQHTTQTPACLLQYHLNAPTIRNPIDRWTSGGRLE